MIGSVEYHCLSPKYLLMLRTSTLQGLFKRDRRRGDLVFAWIFLLFGLFLLSQLGNETTYKSGLPYSSQPLFWPMVSLSLMVFFSFLHLLSSALSPRLSGRLQEVLLWLSSFEYALWFIVYAMLVPYLGYLPSTILLAVLLSYRVGYRSRRIILSSLFSSIIIVLLFKSFLQVKLPSGYVYDYLPSSIGYLMYNYF